MPCAQLFRQKVQRKPPHLGRHGPNRCGAKGMKAFLQFFQKDRRAHQAYPHRIQGTSHRRRHIQRGHRPHNRDCRSLHAGFPGLLRNVCQRTPHCGSVGGVSTGDHRRRGIRGLSGFDQPPGNPGKAGETHQENQRPLQRGQCLQGFRQHIS